MKVGLVLIHEVLEQIINDNFTLDRRWERAHESSVRFELESIQSVVFPVVIEEVLDLGDQVLVQWVAVVEPREESNPLREILVVSKLEERVIIEQNLNELTHYEGKHSNSKH